MLAERGLYSSPPPDPNVRRHNNPTLLFTWWCTGCSVVIILFRLAGRKVRNNVLFREDKLMALSLIPLLIRMAFIHPVLLWGTNNAANTHSMSPEEIYHRSLASRLVLAARIFYAMFIWLAKFTISEFLKRMTSSMWTKSHEWTLRAIRIFLAATFVAVVIATLAECQPIAHYWQVVPDPGPQCRQGYAQLLTMGTADVITDALLIFFPIPVILRSNFTWQRKVSLVTLFSMSAILIAITAYRVPAVIQHHSLQQYRTVWASGEILAAAAVSNAIVLGSFLRDRGVKKAKYKPHRFNSATESSKAPSSRRQTLTQQQAGSDEDLFRDLCYRFEADVEAEERVPRPARPVAPVESDLSPLNSEPNWHTSDCARDDGRDSVDSQELKDQVSIDPMPSPTDTRGTRRVSFFDVGGLLADDAPPSPMLPISPTTSVSTHDFAPAGRGARNAMGDLLSPVLSRQRSPSNSTTSTGPPLRSPPRNTDPPPRGILRRQESSSPSLQDIGGLAPPADAGVSMELHDIGGLLPPSDAGDELQDVGGLLRPQRERTDSRLSPAPPSLAAPPPPQSHNFHLPRPHLPRPLSQPESSGG